MVSSSQIWMEIKSARRLTEVGRVRRNRSGGGQWAEENASREGKVQPSEFSANH